MARPVSRIADARTPPSLKERTSAFLQHPLTDVGVIVLIVASVALLIVEYAFELPAFEALIVEELGVIITWLFVLELSLRYWVAKKKARFFRRYWPDLLAVMPYNWHNKLCINPKSQLNNIINHRAAVNFKHNFRLIG